MRLNHVLGLALLAASVAAPASAAGTCRIDSGATCSSAMPVGGFCQCNVGGVNMGGTIVSEGATRGTANSFQPGAPSGSPGQDLGGNPAATPPPGYAPRSYAPPPGH